MDDHWEEEKEIQTEKILFGAVFGGIAIILLLVIACELGAILHHLDLIYEQILLL